MVHDSHEYTIYHWLVHALLRELCVANFRWICIARILDWTNCSSQRLFRWNLWTVDSRNSYWLCEYSWDARRFFGSALESIAAVEDGCWLLLSSAYNLCNCSQFCNFHLKDSHFENVLTFVTYFRYLKLHNGCYRKIESKTQRNRSLGYADGSQVKQ